MDTTSTHITHLHTHTHITYIYTTVFSSIYIYIYINIHIRIIQFEYILLFNGKEKKTDYVHLQLKYQLISSLVVDGSIVFNSSLMYNNCQCKSI